MRDIHQHIHLSPDPILQSAQLDPYELEGRIWDVVWIVFRYDL